MFYIVLPVWFGASSMLQHSIKNQTLKYVVSRIKAILVDLISQSVVQ